MDSSTNSYWNKRIFCLVTGASSGIGKSFAVEFSKKCPQGSIFLLMARSPERLEQTKGEISHNGIAKASVVPIDLGKPDKVKFLSAITKSLKEHGAKAEDFDHAMIVQSAATLGIQSGLRVEEIDNLQEIQEYYEMNLHSFIVLNSVFFKVFKANQNILRSIVHISSHGAVEPFKTWGLYCGAKAARDMLVKSMALESGIHAINWAPGMVNTANYDEAVKDTGDPELAKLLDETRKAGKILTPEQTIAKLLKVLAGGEYIKGEHLSYYDIPDV